MSIVNILSEIDAELSRLRQARALLSETDSGGAVKRRPGRPIGSRAANRIPAAVAPGANVRTKMSAAGRARIAAAMKKRWAKIRQAKQAAAATPKPLVGAALPKVSAKKATSKKSAVKKSVSKKASPAPPNPSA